MKKELRVVQDGKPGHSISIGTYSKPHERNFVLLKKAKIIQSQKGGEIRDFKLK